MIELFGFDSDYNYFARVYLVAALQQSGNHFHNRKSEGTVSPTLPMHLVYAASVGISASEQALTRPIFGNLREFKVIFAASPATDFAVIMMGCFSITKRQFP